VYEVGMLAEVELSAADTDEVWEPCKIRSIETKPARTLAEGVGQSRRIFGVTLQNKDFLSRVPESRLRPLSAKNALLIDPAVFSDAGSSSGSSSESDSDMSEVVPARGPVPSRPPPQPRELADASGSPFDEFYSKLPGVRAGIRSIGSPARSSNADSTTDADIESVHASLDRMNSEVRGTVASPSYDDSENRADRLERLQEEMDLSSKYVRLNVSSAAASLGQISQDRS